MRFFKPMRRWMSRWALRLLAAALAAATLCFGFQWLMWPDVESLVRSNPESTAFIDAYLSAQKEKDHGHSLQWSWVDYHEISPHLKRAVLVAEDINFFSHDGFEGTEIKAALRRAFEDKSFPRGASTISQQVAKNLWLSPSRNPWRKVKEALLTRELEAKLEKRRILEIYLNCAEFGPGIYGAEAASRAYFSERASQLDEQQAAQIAASLSRPSSWHPGVKNRGYDRRVTTILQRMNRATWLMNVI